VAYSAPDADALKARFPAFADVADATLEAALVRARRHVDDTWIEDDRAEAEMLYAAHDMTLDGLGATREAQLAGFKRLKLDTLELERQASAGDPGTLKSTSYGVRFAELRRRSHPGVKAI
jgi:hypothetical protein